MSLRDRQHDDDDDWKMLKARVFVTSDTREMAAQYNITTMYIVYNAEVLKLLIAYFNKLVIHTHFL